MEKISLIIFFLSFLMVVVLFLFIVWRRVNKVRREEWRGKVVDKITGRDDLRDRLEDLQENLLEDGRKENFFTLVIKCDDGLVRRELVEKDFFDSCLVGERLIKLKGEGKIVKE